MRYDTVTKVSEERTAHVFRIEVAFTMKMEGVCGSEPFVAIRFRGVVVAIVA